jgi:hypothetical protein
MLGLVKMLGGVLIGRRVAAAYVAAVQAEAQVNPATADFEAFLTAVRLGLYVFNRVEMRTFLHFLLLSPACVD